jgi:hypothetical protein
VQAEAAVRDVGGADVLGRRDQVADAGRDERAEGDLKRPRTAADADVFRAGTMNVDRVPADANRVLEVRSPRSRLKVRRHILLDHGAQRFDAA